MATNSLKSDFRLVRIADLLKKNRLQDDFTHDVVADVPKRVEHKVDDLIDWLVNSDLKQWKAITDYLVFRQREHKDQIIGGEINPNFDYDRSRLLEAIGNEVERVVNSYDKQKESEKIAFNAQNAVAASLAMEVGAVGLGALITALATTVAADVTGIVAASLVAVLGLFIIPGSRRKAKKDLHERLETLRTDLILSLRSEFEKEMRYSLAGIEDAIAPYSRFVRSETTRTEQVITELKNAKIEIGQLRAEIENW